MTELDNQVPREVRQWLQTVSLSLPLGVHIYVAGGCPLSLRMGLDVTGVDVFLVGSDILEDKYQWKISEDDEGYEQKQLRFHNRLFEEEYSYQRSHVDAGKIENIRCILFENDFPVLFYFIKDYRTRLSDILMAFDFDICRMWVNDLNTLDWEIRCSSLAEKAIETKLVTLKDNDYFFTSFIRIQKQRVEKYKKKLPSFRFVKEL